MSQSVIRGGVAHTPAERTQTYRDRHKAKGLCVECPNVAAKDRVRCETCLEKKRKLSIAYTASGRRQLVRTNLS